MTIRRFSTDEIPSLLDMRRAMTLELDGKDLDDDPIWRDRFSAFLLELLDKNETMYFVAEHDGALVGMGGVYKLRNHRSVIYGQPSAYVTSVYVLPAHRRNGIARAITQATVDWARENGCVVVRLRASRMGRMVYEAMGFTPTEELELPLTR
ncbi:MAG: GNAT family N-acetyltransferase [Candidatus Eremiobacteraeota bacterium]|nr:GNAT family N-acetyltransferase [Candidatus Eremiobacteraeota bacterium]